MTQDRAVPARLGPAVTDAVVVLAGTLLVLTVLDQSFATRGYLVAGLVPVVLLLGLAAWLTRRDHGGWLFVIAMLVLYAPVGALVALREPGPWILPTLSTMGRVLGETVTAPETFVGSVPPIDAQGSVMMVPYAIGYLAGGTAAGLALGSRHPVWPQVPLLVGLAAAIPLGVLVPDLLLVRGVALAGLGLWWAVLRTRRVEVARGGWTRPVAAALLLAVFATLVGLVVPDTEQADRVLLRTPGDVLSTLDTVSDPLQTSGTSRAPMLLTSGIPRGERIRIAALDTYDGTAWTVAGESPGAPAGAGTFRRVGSRIDPLHDVGRRVSVRVRVRPAYQGDWLPTLGELTSLRLNYRGGRTQLSEVRYNQASSNALVPGGVDPRDVYRFTALLPPTRLRDGDEAARATGAERQPEGAFLDVYLRRFAGDTLAPLDRLELFMADLRERGAVRLGGPTSQTAAGLGRNFVGLARPTGTPHQYAAATALAASRLGVPARVVVGAQPNRRGVVEQRDVESWVEVQVADGTWRRVRPEEYLGVQRVDPEEERARAGVDQRGAGSGPDLRSPRAEPDDLGGDDTEATSRWWVAALWAAGLLAVALLGVLLVAWAKRLRRRRRRHVRAAAWSRSWVGAWQEVLDTARDLGSPVPDHLPRVEQAARLGQGLELARAVDAAVFAPAPAADDALERAWEESDRLRERLRGDASRRRRILAVLSPASLLTSLRRRREAGPRGLGRHAQPETAARSAT